MVEMVETAAILNQAGPRSFVILDEIGRGTATFDGLSIAWAALEHLHEVNRCRALFATHYHELTALAAKLPALACHTMRVKEWKGDVVFLHEVAPGTADRSYGIHVAKLAGLPPSGHRARRGGAGNPRKRRARRRPGPPRRRSAAVPRRPPPRPSRPPRDVAGRGAAARHPPRRADPARGARTALPAEGGWSRSSVGAALTRPEKRTPASSMPLPETSTLLRATAIINCISPHPKRDISHSLNRQLGGYQAAVRGFGPARLSNLRS